MWFKQFKEFYIAMHLLPSKWCYKTAGDVKVFPTSLTPVHATPSSPPCTSAPGAIILCHFSAGPKVEAGCKLAHCHHSLLAPDAAWHCPKHVFLIGLWRSFLSLNRCVPTHACTSFTRSYPISRHFLTRRSSPHVDCTILLPLSAQHTHSQG